jgi:acetyl-CoA carboxylase carboxyltransferase component
MSWRPEIDEIHRRRALAEACGGAEAVAKHHGAGKLTVRERIAQLLDAGTFREVGKLAGRASYDAEGNLKGFEPAPYVMGIGKISGRPIAIGGED